MGEDISSARCLVLLHEYLTSLDFGIVVAFNPVPVKADFENGALRGGHGEPFPRFYARQSGTWMC